MGTGGGGVGKLKDRYNETVSQFQGELARERACQQMKCMTTDFSFLRAI